jgi:hypothetical protein
MESIKDPFRVTILFMIAPPFLSGLLSDLQFADFAEMMAVNRNGDGQCKKLRTAEKSPGQDLPILESLLSEDTEADARTQDCQQALKIQGGSYLWSLILPEEGHRSFIVMLG